MRLTKEQIIRVVNNGAQYTNPTTDEMDFYIKLFFLRYGYFVPTEERKILSSEQLENCMVNYCSKHGRPTGETIFDYIVSLKLPYDDGVIAMKEALKYYGHSVATSEKDERPEPIRRA